MTTTQEKPKPEPTLYEEYQCDKCKHGLPYSYSKACKTCDGTSGYEPLKPPAN